MKSGYYGVGIYEGKESANVGTLWRSAYNFGADYIFTIGKRYEHQRTDTTKAFKHIPLFHFKDWDDFKSHLPKQSQIVFIEQTEESEELHDFKHPKQAVYVLGAEDYGIPEEIMKNKKVVAFDTPMCLNVAVAGSIIMYDRIVKSKIFNNQK